MVAMTTNSITDITASSRVTAKELDVTVSDVQVWEQLLLFSEICTCTVPVERLSVSEPRNNGPFLMLRKMLPYNYIRLVYACMKKWYFVEF